MRGFSTISCLVILFNASVSFSQLTKEDYYNRIDNKIFTYSKKNSKAPFDSVLHFVNQSFPALPDRARAYYTWIALNISYDVTHLNNLNLFQTFNVTNVSSSGQNPDEVLSTQKAVCEGFSNLMSKFCNASGIPCYTVCGYVKTPEGEIPKLMHAWNVLKPDTEWILMDVTWSGGYVNPKQEYVKRFSNFYFATPPKEFIKDHFPLDPMWQLLPYPISKKEFETPEFHLTTKNGFHYKDSLKHYQSLTALEQKELDFTRYYVNEPDNVLFARNLDVWHNNKAADDLNTAIFYQTEFIEIAQQKLAKKPYLADWKKAKMALDSADAFSYRAELRLNDYKPKTEEYALQFNKMKEGIIDNKKVSKHNQEYLKKLKPYLIKK